MKPLSALFFILAAQAIGVEAGFDGLRDAFFGAGPYAIAPLNRRVGGVEIPQRCGGIEQAKRFRPHQPNECRILQVLDATAHGAWNYCPEDPNANCQIPMACVDEDLCRANQCGDFGNKEYTTISCSDSFQCVHTVLYDDAQSEADATRWVCDKTKGLVVSISGTFTAASGLRSFDGRGAQAVIATTFVPRKSAIKTSSTSSSSTSINSASDSSKITDTPPISVSTATIVAAVTPSPNNQAPITNIAPIVGGAVGGFAVLALLVLAIFILWRRHKRSKFTFVPVAPPNANDSNDEKGLNGQQTPRTDGTATSSWMPTPATMQGTWTPNNGTYSGTVSEMPTPDMLAREWNQSGPHELGKPRSTEAAWARMSPMAQGWNGPIDQTQFQGHGLGVRHQRQSALPAVAPGGFPASLTPGMGNEHRAELA